MIFAVTDVETSVAGEELDSHKDECCEFAIIVADWDTRDIICQYSQIYSVKNWNESSAEIHKIPKELSDRYGLAEEELPKLGSIINLDEIEYVVAHNASYDKNVIKRYWPAFAEKQWICSWADFTHDKLNNVTSKRLSHLAADYEIIIPKWHRAHSDCAALLEIVFENNLDDAWKRKNLRRFEIVAKGEYQAGVPEKFKKRRWRWDPSNKTWTKHNTPSDELKSQVEFVKSIGFSVSVEETYRDY